MSDFGVQEGFMLSQMLLDTAQRQREPSRQRQEVSLATICSEAVDMVFLLCIRPQNACAIGSIKMVASDRGANMVWKSSLVISLPFPPHPILSLLCPKPEMGLSWYHYTCKDCKCVAEPWSIRSQIHLCQVLLEFSSTRVAYTSDAASPPIKKLLLLWFCWITVVVASFVVIAFIGNQNLPMTKGHQHGHLQLIRSLQSAPIARCRGRFVHPQWVWTCR